MKLSVLLASAGWASKALASPSSNADAVGTCEYLHSVYPKDLAWDPLSPQGIESILNAPLYNEAVSEYWNGVNSGNRPTCVFFPSSAEQVSTAVKQLNKYSSAEFALKSGGHNFNSGISSTDGGVLISFNQNLASISRSADGESFHVGPGARWGDVYEVTAETNQVLVGGRLGNIGVGGFTPGGGLSYYSAQYGLTCDNVINFEVVPANGTIANANSTSNPDLWWALKGGGNRFAIVTDFTFKAHPLGVDGRIWGGVRVYNAEDRQALFSALSDFIRDYPDAKSAVIPTFNFAGPGIALPTLFFFYDGPTPPVDAFSALDVIESVSDSTGAKSYTDLTNEAGGAKMYGINAAARVNTFPNLPSEQMTELLETHWDLYTSQMKNDSSQHIDIQIGTFATQPLSVRIAKASTASGGNALGLDPDHGDRVWVENDLIWINPDCNEACPKYLKNVSDMINSEFHSRFDDVQPTNYQAGDVDFVSHNPLFMNDAADYQDVYSSYGAANKARLQEIAQAYDTEGFMYRQGGWSFQ